MLLENIYSLLAKDINAKEAQAKTAVKLLDEGNTIPFIARYRKEMTGELKEEQLRLLAERLTYLRNLWKRQQEVLSSIEEQGKLTPEIVHALNKANKLQEIEDIYLPYKQKKRTRAMQAKERGLLPLAELLLAQEITLGDPLTYAEKYIDAEKGVETATNALQGAMDIIAESETEKQVIRAKFRKLFWQEGKLEITRDAEKDVDGAFLMYADYVEPVHTLPSHRILAINRGERKEILKVKLTLDTEAMLDRLYNSTIKQPSIFENYLKLALADGYKRLLFPALEREIRATLTENAEKQAIHVFGLNLRQLLLQAPLAGQVVMGLDPGYRTGCKMAIVDQTGHVLDYGVLYLTASEKQKQQAAEKVLALIKKYSVTLLSIGNGTASLETEEFASQLIKDNHLDVHYLITNEAGASVYSASKLAVAELPDYDVTIRGAVSIARRVQDPLAELVKIDPKAIGVGQYQHDVNQKTLASTLDSVVESAVNHVGVMLNTASIALLQHISGINASVAKNIVQYRDEHGSFHNREELLQVKRFGKATFTQAAGFLRIENSDNPLDNTPIHPESYPLATRILEKLHFTPVALTDKDQLHLLQAKLKLISAEDLAQKLEAGLPTVRDIIAALLKPGRDPRSDFPAPLTRQAIVKLEDIKVGTQFRGTVRNITDFGAFVDIGIKTAGLVHISELSKRHVKHPLDVVSVGDIVNVVVINVEPARNRIGLSMKRATNND